MLITNEIADRTTNMVASKSVTNNVANRKIGEYINE